MGDVIVCPRGDHAVVRPSLSASAAVEEEAAAAAAGVVEPDALVERGNVFQGDDEASLNLTCLSRYNIAHTEREAERKRKRSLISSTPGADGWASVISSRTARGSFQESQSIPPNATAHQPTLLFTASRLVSFLQLSEFPAASRQPQL